MYCLQGFSSKQGLTDHKELCIEINGVQAVKMPKNVSHVRFFCNPMAKKQLPVPFVIYADLEAHKH